MRVEEAADKLSQILRTTTVNQMPNEERHRSGISRFVTTRIVRDPRFTTGRTPNAS